MMNLSQLLTRPSIINRLNLAMLVLALIGFADATFLTAEHYLGKIPPCTIVSGCNAVLTSRYAVIYNVPLALVGALYYLCLAMLLIYNREAKRADLLKIIFALSSIGFISSLGLMALQLFVIKALCLYCIISAVTSTLIWGLGFVFLKYARTI